MYICDVYLPIQMSNYRAPCWAPPRDVSPLGNGMYIYVYNIIYILYIYVYIHIYIKFIVRHVERLRDMSSPSMKWSVLLHSPLLLPSATHSDALLRLSLSTAKQPATQIAFLRLPLLLLPQPLVLHIVPTHPHTSTHTNLDPLTTPHPPPAWLRWRHISHFTGGHWRNIMALYYAHVSCIWWHPDTHLIRLRILFAFVYMYVYMYILASDHAILLTPYSCHSYLMISFYSLTFVHTGTLHLNMNILALMMSSCSYNSHSYIHS